MWEFGDNLTTGVKGSAFLAINENGRVPALEDSNTGVVSCESGACVNYLRRRYDGEVKVFGPRAGRAVVRWGCRMWLIMRSGSIFCYGVS